MNQQDLAVLVVEFYQMYDVAHGRGRMKCILHR